MGVHDFSIEKDRIHWAINHCFMKLIPHPVSYCCGWFSWHGNQSAAGNVIQHLKKKNLLTMMSNKKSRYLDSKVVNED